MIYSTIAFLSLFLVASIDALPPPSVHRNKAWVTLLTGNSYNSTQLVATQALSVSHYSQYKHVTMVLPAVDKETRRYLEDLPTEIVEVPPIYPPHEVDKAYWKDVFAKFNIFSLLEYEQVAFMDGDAFLMKEGADDAFDLCHADLCGVQDNWKVADKEDGQEADARIMINAGVLVVRPSQEKYDFIVNDAIPKAKKYRFPEQGFMTDLYLDNIYGDGAGKFQWLSWKFNTCSRGFFEKEYDLYQEFWGNEHLFKHRENLREQVNIFHHCGDNKLHDKPLCEWAELREEYVYFEQDICGEKQVQLFQELLLESNHCARGGMGEGQCQSMANDCHWCGEDIRCISSEYECGASSAETKVAVERRLASGGRQLSSGQLGSNGSFFQKITAAAAAAAAAAVAAVAAAIVAESEFEN